MTSGSRIRPARIPAEFLNWAANQECGKRADGGFFADLWRGFAAHGLCREDAMPDIYARDYLHDAAGVGWKKQPPR